jgi:hypothetical protein
MPLFFIIAIGAGAFTAGATAVDVTTDSRQARMHQTTIVQPQAYTTDAAPVAVAVPISASE